MLLSEGSNKDVKVTPVFQVIQFFFRKLYTGKVFSPWRAELGVDGTHIVPVKPTSVLPVDNAHNLTVLNNDIRGLQIVVHEV